MGAEWNLAGKTELNQLRENSTFIPFIGVGPAAAPAPGNTITIQQAGFLNKLRGWLDAQVNLTVGAAPVKSAYGPLGGSVNWIRAVVQGRKPFYSLSGWGLWVYNLVCNPDANPCTVWPYLAAAGEVVLVEGTHLTGHTAAAAVANEVVRCPFEMPFGLPVWMTRLIKLGADYIPVQCEEEVGLWHLQSDQSKLSIETIFNPPVTVTVAALGIDDAPLHQAGIVGTWNAGYANQIMWERELFSVPSDPKAWPDQGYIHQVVEYQQPIVASTFRFPIPQVGALLRAILIFEDVNGCPVDWTTIVGGTIGLSFGASDTPIVRPLWAFVDEYMEDYEGYPPIGVVVFDFYKAGRRAARLARDTDRIANMAFFGTSTAGLVTGRVRIILESLVPHRAT